MRVKHVQVQLMYGLVALRLFCLKEKSVGSVPS